MKKAILFASICVALATVLVACGGLSQAEQRYNDGVDAHNAGRIEEAVALYTEAIELDPNLVNAYVNRSAAYGALGRLDEALDDATKAIEWEPKDDSLTQAYGNRANALTGLGRFEEAEADFAKACELGLAEVCGPASTACPTPVPGDPATIGEWMGCEFARCPGAELSDIAGGYGPLC